MRKKSERAQQQTLARVPLCAIKIGARVCAEDVRRVDQYGPRRDHRHERDEPRHINGEQRIARQDRPDKPQHVIAPADNPAQGH